MTSRTITYEESNWSLVGAHWRLVQRFASCFIWKHEVTGEIVFTHGELHDDGDRWRVVELSPYETKRILSEVAAEKMGLL